MTTAAKPVKATTLKLGGTTIAEVLNITGPGESAGAIDVTSQDSTTREFIGDALADGGEVTFDMNFIGSNAQQQALRTNLRAGTATAFILTFNDSAGVAATSFTFTGIITALSPSANVGESYKRSCTIKLAAPATMVYAS